MTARSAAMTSGTRSGSVGLAVGTVLAGTAAALFGLGAFLAVLIGDDLIAFDARALVAVALAALGAVATALVRQAPGPAAVGLATVAIGYVIALGDTFGEWWSAYQQAIATSGAAEGAFWAAMPAMGLFVVSGVLFGVGAVLAALRWDSVTPQPISRLEE